MQLQAGKSMLVEAAVLICKLEDDRLYAPWQVVASGYDRKTQRKEYDRLRLNLGEWTRYHNIRETFENIDASGKRIGRFPAWYGRTWKEHLGYRDLMAATHWIQENEEVSAAVTHPLSTGHSSTAVLSKGIPPSSPKKSYRKELSLATIAAAIILAFLYFSRPSPIGAEGQFGQLESETVRVEEEAHDEIKAFSSQRRAARATRAALRRAPIVHPPLESLVWEMEVVEDMAFQAAFSPNCVFLISRTHLGMMPIPD